MSEKAAKVGRGLSLLSGGLDSQLAICILREQGLHMEAVVFKSPFFKIESAKSAALDMGVKLHVVSFTRDILELIKDPPHGFGGNLNPCIDCHALMIKRAGEMMRSMGFDFVATGEVLNQRPMSQRRVALEIVAQSSELGDRLVRPLSALLLEPTQPELDGIIDRSQLLRLNGRGRRPQMELAKKFGLKSYPSPSGGCLLTESGFCRRLNDMRNRGALDDERLVWMLLYGRHLALPGGGKCIVGRDNRDNAALKQARQLEDVMIHTVNIPGPTVLLPLGGTPADIELAASICASYGDHGGAHEVMVRIHQGEHTLEQSAPVVNRELFKEMIL
ncbi:MAG: tRNA 4-thiouridine(8) synthase ThiI [Kiritimatiellae bacterium]|nr:tRNA 4-thiouridine(8) synthase ThiI [Kiritimatiellia bacterium]